MAPEQWAPFAVRRDGPAEKHGYANAPEPARKIGAVYHSAEGGYRGMMDVLYGPRRASWTFSNPKVSQLEQHYPVGFHVWTNGSPDSNVRFIGVENEGVVGEPLTDSQTDNLAELTAWLYRTQEWDVLKLLETLWEHQWMTRFGSAPTACPSDRIPWVRIIAKAEKLLEETDMTTYKLFQTWGPAKTWIIAYVEGVPIYRRWLVTPEGVNKLRAALGEPETISEGQLTTIPKL